MSVMDQPVGVWPDAGSQAGGGFSLDGGFWAGLTSRLPGFVPPVPGVSAVGLLVLVGLLTFVVVSRLRSSAKAGGMN